MTHLQHALQYLEKGWCVIPIKPDKRPYIQWEEFQHRFPTTEEVTKWWTDHPDANIAVVCGKISGIIVVDIDAKGKEISDIVKGVPLPPTLVSKTGGGGRHYFYKWEKHLIGAKVGIRPQIDIRSEASYVVIPPSLHASGKNYEWMNEGEDINEAPTWLEQAQQPNDKTDWDKFFKEQKGTGLRNASAAQLAGKILYETSIEMWPTLGLGYFRQWNKDYNTPPLSDDELMTTWNSVMRTHTKNNKPPEILSTTGEEAVILSQSQEEEAEIAKQFGKNKTKGTFYIAKYMTGKYNIITVGEKEREMYVYKDGMYFRAENEIIYPEIQRILGENITKNAKTETFHKIADMTSHPRSVLSSADIRYIPLRNGVFDTIAKQLLPHDPKYRFTFQFPIIYDAAATCPRTIEFMHQVLTDEQYPVVEEWIGYYFYRLYSFKKAIVFVGEGDTGKTTLLETIINLLGKENISSVSLHKMTNDRFSGAHLYGKHGNIVDELSARDISDTGNFKIATGGGSISGEYKFGNQFTFQNFSKFTFACNKVPDVTDFDDEAYFNRWMVMRFENTLKKKTPNFIATLTTEEERSGLFNLAMGGLDRLLSQSVFSYGKTAMETKIEMMKSGSSIAIFTAEQLINEPGAEMSKAEMYDQYTSFCQNKGLTAETMDMFGKKFLLYVSYANDGLIYDNEGGKTVRVRGWKNVKVKPSEEEQKLINDFNNLSS